MGDDLQKNCSKVLKSSFREHPESLLYIFQGSNIAIYISCCHNMLQCLNSIWVDKWVGGWVDVLMDQQLGGKSGKALHIFDALSQISNSYTMYVEIIQEL